MKVRRKQVTRKSCYGKLVLTAHSVEEKVLLDAMAVALDLTWGAAGDQPWISPEGCGEVLKELGVDRTSFRGPRLKTCSRSRSRARTVR